MSTNYVQLFLRLLVFTTFFFFFFFSDCLGTAGGQYVALLGVFFTDFIFFWW